MSLTTNFNENPFWDDFNEDDNYHRILFKPSVAVQARELTQLQTILQTQVERFGENVLKEGTIVKGGNFVEVNPLPYVKLIDKVLDSSGIVITNPDVGNFTGLTAVGLTTGLRAIVVTVGTGNQTTPDNTKTIFVKYINNAQTGGNNIEYFDSSETIELRDSTDQLVYTVTAAGSIGISNPVGNGYGVRCGEGVLFQKGHFIKFSDDITIVSRYTTTPTDIVVGFKTAENIITASSDANLLDNAQGYNNYNAPGADRLKLTPVLTAVSSSIGIADSTFFALQEYQNGKVVRRRLATQFNAFENTIERRTSEESGNYTVKDFKVKLEEKFDDTTKLSVNLSPGVAYVEGKRTELVNNYNIEIDKSLSTDIKSVFNQNMSMNYGQYVIVSDASGGARFDIENIEEVTLHDSGQTQIGTARVRNIHQTYDGTLRLYLFAIKMGSTYQFSQVTNIKSVAYPTDGNVVISDTTLYDYNFRRALFPIGKDFTAAVDPTTSYTYRGTVTGLALASDTANFTISGQWPYSVGTLTEDEEKDFILVNDNAGEIIPIQSIDITSASSATINANNSGVSASTTLYHNAILSGTPNINTKTLGTFYFVIDSAYAASTNYYSLGIPDIYSLEEVRIGNSTGAVVTSSFSLDTGQRDSYYAFGGVKRMRSVIAGDLWIKVKAFQTGTMETFFAVNSYPVDDVSPSLPANKIRTEEIPNYTMENGSIIRLRDTIDFRPVANAVGGSYTGTAGSPVSINTDLSNSISFTGSTINFPQVNTTLNLTYDYNLGRYDRLVIDEKGNFRVIVGEAADEPIVPVEPTKGMSLAVLSIPPYPSVPMATASRVGKPEYGISVSRIDNRRYTMKDIGQIESRVKTLEYYTSLNVLEKNTKDLIIVDGAGVDRFKNGIMVDNFKNLSIARISSPEFSAAIDPSYGELMPRFRSLPISLKPTGVRSNITDYGIAATLAKSDVKIMEQPYATDTKSCTTDFYKFTGAMTIYPEYDTAPDVTIAPDVNLEVDLSSAFVEFADALSEFVPFQNVNTRVVNLFGRGGTGGRQQITTRNTLDVIEGESTTQPLGEFVSNVQFDPYMRTKNIEVSVNGLRPNTRFWVYFDGKDVMNHVATGERVGSGANAYVSATGAFGDGQLISDSNGTVQAIFRIPSGTFSVGDRLLEIFDRSTYSSKENATSYASRTYSAFNFSYDQTGTTITTRQPQTVIESTTRVRNIPPQQRGGGGGSDPIAQTFILDAEQSNDTSLMLTKLDLYFARASTTGNGVTVAIVETDNGYPTGKVIPFSEKRVENQDVVANEISAANPTTVTFDAPVAIKTGIEYAIVIYPEANDPDYLVWVSTTGGTDVDTGVSITQDTNAGLLFTSTNAKAWTPYQDQNLKFNIYRAEYSQTSGSIQLTTNDVEMFTIDGVTGDFEIGERIYISSASNLSGTVSGTLGSKEIAGVSTSFTSELTVGDYIKISGENKLHRIATVTDNSNIILESSLLSTVSGATYNTSATGEILYQNRNFPQAVVLENSTARIGSPDVLFTVGDTITGEKSGISATIDSINNTQVSYLQPSIFRSNFTKTKTTANLISNGVTRTLAFNTNNYMNNYNMIVKSRSNEITDNNGSYTFLMTVNLETIADDITATSPLIDYDISNVMLYEYQINNPSPSNEESFAGDATSKYISKTVELKDGLAAEDLKVFLTTYKPSGTDIEVYARIQSQYDDRSFDAIEWTKLAARAETNQFSSNDNRLDFREIEYELTDAVKLAGEGAWLDGGLDSVKYITPDGAVFVDMKKFAIKIVLLSSNQYDVPRVKDLRAIAVS